MAVKDWSVTAADNDDADNTINWLEGQAPSTVNDSARAMMAALKSWYNLIDAGTISNGTVGGTANAITLTCSPTVPALAAGQRYLFKYTSTGNTGGVTLNVDGLGAAAIQFKGAALVSGDIATNDWVLVTHDGSVFQMLNEPRLSVIATHAASVSEALTGTATNKVITPDALAAIWQRGTDIASASSLTLPSGGGNVFNVTGTTTIDGISSAQGGRCVKLYFAGALTLTHNASSFVLPSGVNVITAAGDTAEFINDAAADASGSNWRCFNYQRANGNAVTHFLWPTVFIAANYTATIADINKCIFIGNSATSDVTLSLPAAASVTGQTYTIINTSPDYGVIIDPNGGELIDSTTTRRTNGQNRVQIFSDGSEWRTISGFYRYVSPSIALTTAATFGGAHGLGTTPHTVLAVLVCQTGEHGYSAGDRLYLPGYTHGAGGTNTGFTVGANATNVFGVLNDNTFSGTSTGIGVRHKTTGVANNITAANWKILVEAMAS